METKEHQWMTGGRLTKYQAIFLYSPNAVLKTCQTLNLATPMPGPDHATTVSTHDCKEIIELVYSSHPDRKDQAIDNADDSWVMDCDSFTEGRQSEAGYTIVSLTKTIKANLLPTYYQSILQLKRQN